TYEELCAHCDVSLSTIKRDVQYLASKGLLIRTRGGARISEAEMQSVPSAGIIEPFSYAPNLDRIAIKAAELVKDNNIVYLGSGVTVAHMVRHLQGHKDLTIITNNIYVLQEAFQYDMQVMMIGGMLARNTMSNIGIQSVNQLRDFNANIAFMSCNGVALSHGITNSNEMEGDIKKVAIQISHKSVLLAANNKFDKISLYTIARMTDIDTLITDKPLDDQYVKKAQDSNTTLIVADE
ncbi:MAG: DeoR/GlpR transcriptional regulator, partial [Eubacterium sp.]|nr:DeoR/GlpR transcriptional regulator [Eubacterium sp.]